MLFGLAACDSSDTSDGTNTATVVEDYTGPDYTQVISAEEVRDGVAFGDLIMGNPDAPVTMIEYASLTCGHCGNFHMQVFPDFKEQYIKTGKVRLIYRNYTRDPADLAVGMLTRCVGPDQAFDLMAIFFERQRQWVVEDAKPEIAAIARRVGINRADMDACLANTDLQRNLVDMLRAGQAEGVAHRHSLSVMNAMSAKLNWTPWQHLLKTTCNHLAGL
ncbi:MAG: thioredoxin domain-containing protein [Proteobacteria bacterium]|nr:thioredoxin domain-containing protein [Pseudomonadota bacterium]